MNQAAFKINVLFFSLLIFFSCKKDNDKSTNTGKIVFYTNAQAMLNCGPFDVAVYINSDLSGKISTPYTGDIEPTVVESNSVFLVVNKSPGNYTYSAKFSCGESITTWSGEVQVETGDTVYVFLDISKRDIAN